MDYHPISPALKDVLTAIRHRKRVDEVVELILDRGCQLAGAVHGSFITVNHASGRLIITSTHGPDWTLEKQNCQLRIGEGITGKVARTGIPYLCSDTLKDPDYYPLFDYVRSELAVPVFVEDRVWGIINMDGLKPHAFDANTLTTLSVFAELASFAITLRIELNEQERLHQHLVQQEKLASLGEIIAGIAHEINNPLTSILGHASLLTLKRGGAEDEKSIEAILSEARRTAELVRNLLAFSRKESDVREIVGINDLIHQICVIKQYQLKVNNIQLIEEPEPISYPVRASAQQIQQVLLNLVNNAEQAIAPGRHDGVIRIGAFRRGEKVIITVRDNGSGIPTEIQKFVFDPFFTTKQLGEGTGLGLSIAHSIVEAHGGNLSFVSDPSGGTTFSIELPLAGSPETPRMSPASDPPPEPTPPAFPPAAGSAPRRHANGAPACPGKVLIVDDEPQIVEALTDFLGLMRVDAISARDGTGALESLQGGKVDVIVSDIRMPGMDGLELYRRAVALDRRYACRFIFMSGDLVRESTKRFVRDTGCICLEKPFSMETLYRNLLPHFDATAPNGSGSSSAGRRR